MSAYMLELPKCRSELKKKIITHGLLPYKCMECQNVGIWRGRPISLQLDHINGSNNDNRLENLRFLCPNCHAQTPTYSRGNVKRRSLYTRDLEDKILSSIDKFDSGRQLLIALGLSDHSSQYTKIYRILEINKKDKRVISFRLRQKQRQKDYRSNPRLFQRKAERPSKEELFKLVWEMPSTEIAKHFGVNSSNTILKWCRDYGISKPTRGHWMKLRAEKIPKLISV